MQENPVQQKFKEAVTRHENVLANLHLDYFLAELQGAVEDLRNGGMNVTMEARPRQANSPVATTEGRVYANAVVMADGQRIDWILSRDDYRDESILSAYLGGAQFAKFTTSQERNGTWSQPVIVNAATLREAIANVILQGVAEHDVAAKYDVRMNGLPSVKDVKVLPKPLKAGP